MAKHIWTVLCRRAVLDKFTNTASMFDTLEEVTATLAEPLPDKWTLLPLEAVLVSFVVRTNVNVPERPRLKVEVVGPNGDVYEPSISGEFDLTEYPRARTFIKLGSLPVLAFGTHKYMVYLEEGPDKWTEVAEIPLDFKLDEIIPEATAATKKLPKRNPSKKAISKA